MEITHDIAGHRFVATLPGGQGELVYRVRSPQTLDFMHTEVGIALRGQGVADAIATAAFAYARRNGDAVMPSCPFVQKWVLKHPEFQDLIAAV